MSGKSDGSGEELPSWTCEECNQSFEAFTERALEQKVKTHQASCNPNPQLEWECETCGKEFEAKSEIKLQHKISSHQGACQAPESGRCERCGRVFEAQSNEMLLQKLEDHRSDCYDVIRHSPEEDIGISSIPVPRSPSEYRKTNHFVARKKTRTSPPVTKRVIFRTLSEGRIIPTNNPQRYKIKKKIGRDCWIIVVHLIDEAFVNADKQHFALTIYEENSHQHEQAADLGI